MDNTLTLNEEQYVHYQIYRSSQSYHHFDFVATFDAALAIEVFTTTREDSFLTVLIVGGAPEAASPVWMLRGIVALAVVRPLAL